MLRVEAMDHVVLVVEDVDRSVKWYRDRLNLEVLRYDEWRNGDAPFPSVRVNRETIIDILRGDRSGTNVDHPCLVVEPVDLTVVVGSGDFDVVEGPVTRWGARGRGRVDLREGPGRQHSETPPLLSCGPLRSRPRAGRWTALGRRRS
jgi:catechol 2,3-dioxygenase-like lactoylglutathione lyase family enzyme